MKGLLVCLFILTVLPVTGQKKNELLVYSVRGKATVVENKREYDLKIGKVLQPAAIIKTQQDTRVIMVCSQGKPISVMKKGNFPVSRWKDSCQMKKQSLSDEYFRYIWKEMLGDSKKNYKRDNTKTADKPAFPGDFRKIKKSGPLAITPMIPALQYAGGEMRLSWTGIPSGFATIFILTDTAGRELYRDSTAEQHIDVAALLPYFEPGKTYYWSVYTKDSKPMKPGAIHFLTAAAVASTIATIEQSVTVPETAAEKFFRIAFLLEQKRYLADALQYYQLAASDSETIPFFKDKLIQFRGKYRL